MRDQDLEASTAIELDLLAGVTGGMKWDQFRRSTNVEDRSHWSRWESRHAPVIELPDPRVGPRTPNDLPHQAGLDDLDTLHQRLRAARRRR